MDDEPLDDRDEENSDYDTTDPEVPLVLHPPPSHHSATRSSHLDTFFNWVRLARSYIGRSYVWRNVLWNRGFWNFAATIAIALATVLYTHYSRRQLKAINDQLPELHSSAEAAKSAAETAKRTLGDSAKEFRIEERPYGVVQNVKFKSKLQAGNDIVLQIVVDNSGQTPALKVSFVEVQFKIDDRQISSPKKSSEEYVISSHHPIDKHYRIQFSDTDVRRLTAPNKPAIFKVEGKIRYTDVFNEMHQTTYCSFYDAREAAFNFCSSGNDVR
jgi:hypothetical protein